MTNQTRTEPLDRLAELEQAATPGPWTEVGRDVDFDKDPTIGERSGLGYEIDGPPEAWHRGQFALHADAAFIAALRNAAPSLIAEAREAARLRTALPSKAYAVVYSNYSPAEIDSLWQREEDAEAEAERLGDPWHVEAWTLRAALVKP